MSDTKLKIGKYELNSRLILGTGKYATLELMVKALEVSGSDMITVAIGRVNLDQPGEKNLLDWIDKKRYQILPNTAGAYTAKDAVRIARLGRAAGLGDLVKVEVIGYSKT